MPPTSRRFSDYERDDGNYLPPMNAREWLAYLQKYQPDTSLLLAHETDLHEATRRGLQIDWEVEDAIELLMLVFPLFGLVLAHLETWWALLLDALDQAQKLRNSATQIKILTQLGESYVVFGKQAAAQNAFVLALERARERRWQEMMLAAYIGLVRAQTYHLNHEFNVNLSHQLAALADAVRDEKLRALAHQTLATVYGVVEDWPLALGHGQTAYFYWQHQKDHLGMAQTAFLIAVIYRKMRRFDLATFFFDRSQESFAQTNYTRQYGLNAYEEGVACLQTNDYEAAEQWFQMALQEFNQLSSPYDLAMSHHGLGLALTGLRHSENARQHLKQAIFLWQQLNNQYEQANAYQAMAYLEGLEGHRETALAFIERAERECRKLPPAVKKCERLQKHIEETRREILANEFGLH
ncbi:MAG TPA: hypothetical protein VHO69_05210 [Phototrophicaceae bacterium]|nr:hypothetical protein [Phototrophicaceae bacterium]